jgi:hypothetical protein
MKRGRELFRQDCEISLNKSIGDASGRTSHAGTAGKPSLPAWKQIFFLLELLACRQNGHDIALPIISTAVKLMGAIKSNPSF